jgi:hypothetical protein
MSGSGAPERTLYQFPISHYSEKARWSLAPSDLPPRVEDLRRAFRDRPAGRWVTERYRHDRQPGAAG